MEIWTNPGLVWDVMPDWLKEDFEGRRPEERDWNKVKGAGSVTAVDLKEAFKVRKKKKLSNDCFIS